MVDACVWKTSGGIVYTGHEIMEKNAIVDEMALSKIWLEFYK